jgi:hypothetical protein
MLHEQPNESSNILIATLVLMVVHFTVAFSKVLTHCVCISMAMVWSQNPWENLPMF